MRSPALVAYEVHISCCKVHKLPLEGDHSLSSSSASTHTLSVKLNQVCLLHVVLDTSERLVPHTLQMHTHKVVVLRHQSLVPSYQTHLN